MIELTSENTKGKIQNYLYTYKNIRCFKGDKLDYYKFYNYFIKNIDGTKTVVALDIEAKKVYCVDNFITHFSLCYKYKDIYYSYCFTIRDLSDNEKKEIFETLNNFKSKIVLHNAYYDIGQIKYLHNVNVKWDYDTYIIFHTLMSHRAKDDSKDFGDEGENDKGLSLKDFTRDYLPYGDYESELEEEKKRICKELNILKGKFTYDLFSDDIIMPYNCFDTLCTLQAFEVSINLFKELQNLGLDKLKDIIRIKKQTMDIYINSYVKGVSIDYNKVLELGNYFSETKINSEKTFLDMYKKEIAITEMLHRVKEYENVINESMGDFLNKVEQKGNKKGKTEKIDNKIYYKKGIFLTQKQSEKIIEKSKFSLTSTQKKTTLLVEVLGLKPLDKGKSEFKPIMLSETDDIFSKCYGYKLNDKTGKREKKLLSPKTDITFLTTYVGKHKSLQNLMDYGKCNTALNNFLGINKTEDDNKNEVDGKTLAELTNKGNFNIVYPSYNILGTITNRCTCQRPNLQQIPSRGVLHPLKECFKARDGYSFYYADYSSAEIVILTAIINSKRFNEALTKGWDLHSLNVWFMLKDRVLEQAPEFQELWDNCKTDDDFKQFYKEIKNRFEDTLRYQCKSLNKNNNIGMYLI